MEKFVNKGYGDDFSINKSLFFEQTEQFNISFIQFDLAHISCHIFLMSETFIDGLFDNFLIIFLKS